ncbi:MAG: methyltransferase [Dongiaceae bacterium]
MSDAIGFEEMRRQICGFAVTAAVSAVTRLGLPDRLAQGPRRAEELAGEVGVDAVFLARTLRYLASEGVLEARADGSFALNERSRWLRSDVAGSLAPRAAFSGAPLSWAGWGGYLAALRSGRSGVEAAFGKPLFELLQQDADSAAIFERYMTGQTAASVAALLAVYDFAGIGLLVDVGGSRGALLAGVLAAHPAMRGILLDLPKVVAHAGPVLAGVAERCSVVGGDFFTAVPAGGDAYVLKFILHDWDDARCATLLEQCRRAMAPGGRVLVMEHIVPEGPGPHMAHFMDLNMLALTDGGRERTEAEYRALLRRAGLALGRSLPTPIGVNLLECLAA